MAAQPIWFDGVDKKLIETHCVKKKAADGNDQTLVTKTPLVTLASYRKKKKEEIRQKYKPQKPDSNKMQINRDSASSSNKAFDKDTMNPHTGLTEELAIDCEMVECYERTSVLARVSIVNLFGHPVLDKYVAPPDKVTDYRTRWSGIRRRDLEGAPDFESVQQEVADMIRGRIVVGHAVHHDFAVLKINHPPQLVRDTSHYFKYLFGGKTPSLKKLTESLLGLSIQKGEHCSVQDAQATMKLYVKERDKWNKQIMSTNKASANPAQLVHKTTIKKKQSKKPLKKKIKSFYVMTT